jgi:hypothetical protein
MAAETWKRPVCDKMVATIERWWKERAWRCLALRASFVLVVKFKSEDIQNTQVSRHSKIRARKLIHYRIVHYEKNTC